MNEGNTGEDNRKATWDRAPLFWRFQLGGWFAFSIFSFPTKWVIIESLRESVIDEGHRRS